MSNVTLFKTLRLIKHLTVGGTAILIVYAVWTYLQLAMDF